MAPAPDPAPLADRAAALVRLCWRTERLREDAAAAGAAAAARGLAEARDALLQDILLDEAVLAAMDPAQILALLGLRRSAR